MKTKKTVEEIREELLQRNIIEMETNIARGILPINPTRIFVVDERVIFGAMKESYIKEVYHDNLYYKIVCKEVKRERDKPASDEYHIIEWFELYKYENVVQPTTFRQEETYRIVFTNSSIDSLLSQQYNAGVEFDVDYQRGYVWTIYDKIKLIDSIFANIDIGKFVFVRRDFKHDGKLYEILDGKQRLSTICEFYEDRFKYRGYYFSELSFNDRNKFLNHGISAGTLNSPTKKQIYDAFIKLNTAGKPMEESHINYVKILLNSETEE